MHAYNLRCTHHPWSPCMHAHERAHRARPETLPVVLSAVVAAGLVGYIGYTVYTGKGKNSPMSTIGMRHFLWCQLMQHDKMLQLNIIFWHVHLQTKKRRQRQTTRISNHTQAARKRETLSMPDLSGAQLHRDMASGLDTGCLSYCMLL